MDALNGSCPKQICVIYGVSSSDDPAKRQTTAALAKLREVLLIKVLILYLPVNRLWPIPRDPVCKEAASD
jgi:hypothetical protein